MNDFLKEKISYYKLLLTFFVTALYGITGWYFANKHAIGSTLATFTIFGFIAIVISIGAIIYKIRFYTEQLKEED